MPVWAGSLDCNIHAKNETGDHTWFVNNDNIVNIDIFRISIIKNYTEYQINKIVISMTPLIRSCHDVILYSFFLPESGVRSCTVGYAVALYSIIWIHSCMVISQFSTVHIVKSVQVHMFLCNCVA